tara:strand:+ start:1105 stop:1608 length:504 start_codon:yes stop_codon:yes gene_type:complete
MNCLYLENESQQLESMNKESMGPGLYMMDVSKKLNQVVYPWAPTVRLQKMGASINQNMSLIDTESDLYNIVRVNTRDPTKKYIPDPDKKVDYLDLKDGFFHEESTLLTNPPSELRGVAKNRFYNLFKDPQKTAIEPAKIGRIGEDTYSSVLDDYKSCPFNKSMYENF